MPLLLIKHIFINYFTLIFYYLHDLFVLLAFLFEEVWSCIKYGHVLCMIKQYSISSSTYDVYFLSLTQVYIHTLLISVAVMCMYVCMYVCMYTFIIIMYYDICKTLAIMTVLDHLIHINIHIVDLYS